MFLPLSLYSLTVQIVGDIMSVAVVHRLAGSLLLLYVPIRELGRSRNLSQRDISNL